MANAHVNCATIFLAISISLAGMAVFATGAGIFVPFTCPHWSFPNVSITPCNYYELLLITKFSQSNRIVSLQDEYFLRVVVRQDTSPALCILHGTSSSNTSYTLQIITSVEESPLCSPEQRPECLPSTHVNFDNTDFFGVSVWNQNTSSAHYLIVNTNAKLISQTNLTSSSFNLQNLWYNALDCKQKWSPVIAYAVLAAVSPVVGVSGVIIYHYLKYKYKERKEWSRYTRGLRDGDDVTLITMDADTHSLQGIPSSGANLPSSAESEQGHDIRDIENRQQLQPTEAKPVHCQVEVELHNVARDEEAKESHGDDNTPSPVCDLDQLTLTAAFNQPPRHSTGTHEPLRSAVSKHPNGDHATNGGMTEDHSQKGLAAAKGSQPDITNGLTGHEGDGSVQSRRSSTGTISAKSEQGHQGKSKLVGCPIGTHSDSGSSTPVPGSGSSSPGVVSRRSCNSALSEQEDGLEVLSIASTGSRTSLISTKLETNPQGQSELVSSYNSTLGQQYSDSPANGAPIQGNGSSSPGRSSLRSSKSEQGRDEGQLVIPPTVLVNQQSTVNRTSGLQKISSATAPLDPLHRKPTLKDLDNKVTMRVAGRWMTVGLQLGIEDYVLQAVMTPNGSNAYHCREMFRYWLDGEDGCGTLPRTWSSVLDAVENGCGSEVSREIAETLH